MATELQIAQFRRATDQADNVEPYTDSYISNIIDELGFETAASSVWREKAAGVAGLVDMTESGSSRRLSQLRQAYLDMANVVNPVVDDAVGGSYVVGIERI